jgi:RHS repeat-associated protein
VYFDDLNITHTKSNVIQYNEYYPFGLQADKSWTRTNAKNNFLFNGGTELNATSGYYDLHYRNYDAAIGRFIQVDPMSVSEMAIYQYAGNNPVMFNDLLGDTKTPDGTGRQLGIGGRAIYAAYYRAAGLNSLADYLEFGAGGGGAAGEGGVYIWTPWGGHIVSSSGANTAYAGEWIPLNSYEGQQLYSNQYGLNPEVVIRYDDTEQSFQHGYPDPWRTTKAPVGVAVITSAADGQSRWVK